MFSAYQNRSNGLQEKLFVFFIAAYPVLFIFQGIDFTDFGFCATNYKFIFTNPSSIYTSMFSIYLTNVIGGLVHKTVGNLGLLGFKIAYVLELYVIYYLIYRLLITFFDKKNVLISLLVSGIYINYYEQGTLNWISYNDLSALFYIGCAYALFKGLEKKNNTYFVAAGFCLGLNFFIRISNLSGLLLLLVIVTDSYLHDEVPLKKMSTRLGYCGGGIILGILTVVLLLIILGHAQLYMDSFRLLYNFKSITPSHNVQGSFLVYLYDLGQSLLTATYFIFVGLAVLLFSRYVPVKNYFLLTIAGLTIAYFLSIVNLPFLAKIKEYYHIRWIFWQSGVLVLALCYMLLKSYKGNPSFFNLSCISFIILLITPLGSDRSLLNANFGMWLALPLTISSLLGKSEIQLNPFTLAKHVRYLFNFTILAIISLYAINANYHEVFRDSSNRFELVTPVRDRHFKGIYTTQDRSRSIEELMHAVSLYITPSDYVLGHEYLPMANYVTDCPPYMYNPNPMYFTVDVYNFLYLKARKEIKQFPVILSAKGFFDKQWPRSVAQGLKHQDPAYDKLLNQQRATIESLKKDGDYYKAWANVFFEIWKARRNSV